MIPYPAPLQDRRPKSVLEFPPKLNRESGIPAILGHVTYTLQNKSCDQESGSGDVSGDHNSGSCDHPPAWTPRSMKREDIRRMKRPSLLTYSAEKRSREDEGEKREDACRDEKKIRLKLSLGEELCGTADRKMKIENLSSLAKTSSKQGEEILFGPTHLRINHRHDQM